MTDVRYIDECKWQEVADGFSFEFLHVKGEKFAEVAMVNFDAKLWKFEVFLPERFQIEGRNASGIVFSSAAARRIAETILLNTVLIR